jgi:hypothetical protein
MTNDTESPNVNSGEQNVPENLAEQSGLPNMSSTKPFTVQTDLIVEGDVYANAFIGDGSQLTGISGGGGGTYATLVGYNPADPSDLTSIVLDSKDGLDPATFRGDIINDSGSVIVDVSSPSATFSGTLLGTVAGNSTTLTGSHTILDVGTDGTDGSLDITDITADGTVDFTGATLIGISTGGLDSAGVQSIVDDNILGSLGDTGVTIGPGASAASDQLQQVVIGPTATSSGQFNVAIGRNAKVQSSRASGTAVGNDARVGSSQGGNNGVAIGVGAVVERDAGTSIGPYATTKNGSNGVAVGMQANAWGASALALGHGASATTSNTIAIGSNTRASTQYGIDIRTSAAGSLTYDTTNDWTFGATVNAPAFVGDGSGLTNLPSGGGLDSAAVEAMIDSDLVGAESPNSYTMKIGANADRIAIGKNAVSDRVNSISIGTSAGRYIDGGSGHVAIGDNAGGAAPGGGGQGHNIIAIGTNASTDISSVQYDTIAMGYNAGRTNMGNYAIAIGSGTSTNAAGIQSVALGYNADATGYGSIAIGAGTGASSNFAIDISTSAAGSLTYDTTNDWTFGAGVTMTDLTASGATVIFSNLPVIDPVNAGQLWNDGGTLKVSAG